MGSWKCNLILNEYYTVNVSAQHADLLNWVEGIWCLCSQSQNGVAHFRGASSINAGLKSEGKWQAPLYNI